MSGFFGRAVEQLGGLFNSGQQGAVGNLLSQAMSDAGGLPGLLAKFDEAGFGDHIRSWIGSGGNLPISAEEITNIFPPEQIEAWAQQHGLPADAVPQVLAHLLPHAVDSATPQGEMPSDADGGTPSGSDLQGLLGRFLGR
ncbi:MAG TPA: YidB family protein [Stellaceae bacterium]|nr:YidB family protein [Stellaceae bacterium]